MAEAASLLPTGRLAAFSALAVPLAAAQIPLVLYLPALLPQISGMGLSTLGLIFLVEKTWGIFADPLIGALSDRTSSLFWHRRGWAGAGAILFAAATLLLFFPRGHLSPLDLLLSLSVFYLGWSMAQIPYLAWSAELSQGYNERTRIATYQTVAGSLAVLLMLVLPTVIDQIAPKDARLKLESLGGLLFVMLALSLPVTLRAFPNPPAQAKANRTSLASAFTVIWRNPLLLRILASDFAVTLGQNIRGTLFIFFVVIFMGLPKWSSGLFLAQFIVGLAAGPIWMQVGYRLGKHRAAVAGELLQAAINFSLLLVRPGDLPLLLALTLLQGLSQGSGNLMLRAMLADVADQDRLSSGQDRTALFFSVFSISSKAAMAAAIGIALPLVAWFGFNPHIVNTPAALHGLLLVFALGPAFSHIAAASLVAGFPLDEAAHREVRRQLAELNTVVPPDFVD
jgi:GPH family glycoside/pentoside/hexuronide:cation symporter